MEDTYIVTPFITDSVSIFGVFDGHGGKIIKR